MLGTRIDPGKHSQIWNTFRMVVAPAEDSETELRADGLGEGHLPARYGTALRLDVAETCDASRAELELPVFENDEPPIVGKVVYLREFDHGDMRKLTPAASVGDGGEGAHCSSVIRSAMLKASSI